MICAVEIPYSFITLINCKALTMPHKNDVCCFFSATYQPLNPASKPFSHTPAAYAPGSGIRLLSLPSSLIYVARPNLAFMSFVASAFFSATYTLFAKSLLSARVFMKGMRTSMTVLSPSRADV